jgi:hypothetical protein
MVAPVFCTPVSVVARHHRQMPTSRVRRRPLQQRPLQQRPLQQQPLPADRCWCTHATGAGCRTTCCCTSTFCDIETLDALRSVARRWCRLVTTHVERAPALTGSEPIGNGQGLAFVLRHAQALVRLRIAGDRIVCAHQRLLRRCIARRSSSWSSWRSARRRRTAAPPADTARLSLATLATRSARACTSTARRFAAVAVRRPTSRSCARFWSGGGAHLRELRLSGAPLAPATAATLARVAPPLTGLTGLGAPRRSSRGSRTCWRSN